MNWYVAKIVFQIISGDGRHLPQFDEQLRLLCADNEREAFAKARNLGLQNQDSFMNDARQPVKWQFIDVAELNPINEPADGTELYYHIHEADDASLYIKWAHHKAALINIEAASVC